MKAYGKDRRDVAGRKLRGTNRDCPCCIPSSGFPGKNFKKRARQSAKKQISKQYD